MIKTIKNIYGLLFFYIFRIFPLKNKIVFSCFHGRNCDGNPRYISNYLLDNRKDIKQVWLSRKDSNFELDPRIKIVKWGSLSMIYEMATAKIWADSHNKPTWCRKRKKQFYIETWHGGLGMKKIESDAETRYSPSIENNIKHNSKMADLFISNSTHLTNIYKRAFWYNGPIVESGFPKNDIFYKSEETHKEIRKKVLNRLNIPLDKKIVLYAPTFRDSESLEVYDIDFVKLRESLKEKFNEDFIVCIRLHPQMKKFSKVLCESNNDIVNATYYEDMQELIIATDIFITDYSSGIFDFALLRRAGFLYAKDIKEYGKERGFYFDLHNMPFPLAQNNDELVENIKLFDYNKYKEKLEKFFTETGLKDNANSVQKISDIIEQYIDNGKIIIEGEK